MAQSQKPYGLLVPKKVNQGPLQPRLAVFGDNSDSDNEDGADWVKKALKRDSQKVVQKKQTQLQMKRAVEQDPTVYQYDEVYDKMEQEKSETKAIKKDQEKKPRYIQSLLKQAERRKREQERRLEREVQKERVAEGSEFKDKEEFVTSAYRKKLEEFKQMDEEERIQDHIEALTDVSKQKDLTGFYRHMYRQAVGEESKSDVIIKQEKIDVEEKTISKPPDTASMSKTDTKEQAERKTTRQYRKRKSSSSESEQELETKQTRHEKNNDEDSDFTGQSSSSDSSLSETSDTEERKQKKSKEDKKIVKNKEMHPETFTSGSEEGEIIEAGDNRSSKRKGETNKDEALSNKKSRNDKSEVKEKTDKSSDKKGSEENNNKLEAPKQSIWEKRTVGPVFEAALERYFARKSIKAAS